MILVTGGTGFIGGYLVRELAGKGEKIRVLKREQTPNPFPEDISSHIEWASGDLTDITSLENAMKGVDHVYHCAAIISFNPKDKEKMMKVNVEGTANLVNVALTNGVKKFLHISSIAAIGRDAGSYQVDEKTEWKKSKLNSNYAISKYRAEREVWRAGAEGLNVVIVNPSVVIGAGNWNKGTGRFFLNCWKGLPGYVSGGTGFVDVRDVVKASVQLMESDISNERFILNGENTTYKDFFFSICDTFKKPRPKREAKKWMMEILWRWYALQSSFNGKEPLVTKETARVSAQQFFYSNEKIRAALNYQFIPLQETIEETCRIFPEETVK